MGDKFIVVGSNSFTGSHLVKRLLRNGHDVLAISRSEQPDQVYPAGACQAQSRPAPPDVLTGRHEGD